MIVAGIDEVGKGCLFGPVFASAVILSNSTGKSLIRCGLKDSKQLTKKKRAAIVPVIKKKSISWGIGQASAQEIDDLGIRKATEKAMLRAIDKLSFSPKLILVDGSLPLSLWEGAQKTVIKGDSHIPSIAAASVLAKETRDELIKRIASQFNGYGLETNMGYGTSFHRTALQTLGPTRLHRKSFLSRILP